MVLRHCVVFGCTIVAWKEGCDAWMAFERSILWMHIVVAGHNDMADTASLRPIMQCDDRRICAMPMSSPLYRYIPSIYHHHSSLGNSSANCKLALTFMLSSS